MHLHSQQLEDENRMLSEKDARNIAETETLRQQLAELMERPQREAPPEEDKREVSEGRCHAGGAGVVRR